MYNKKYKINSEDIKFYHINKNVSKEYVLKYYLKQQEKSNHMHFKYGEKKYNKYVIIKHLIYKIEEEEKL
jgi:hypothetical protein